MQPKHSVVISTPTLNSNEVNSERVLLSWVHTHFASSLTQEWLPIAHLLVQVPGKEDNGVIFYDGVESAGESKAGSLVCGVK